MIGIIKNNYTVNGEVVTFHIKRRNGDMYDVLVDLEDLEKISDFDCAICLTWKKNVGDFYAQMSKYMGTDNGKRIIDSRTLHRFVMDAKENEVIDHKNHNTLDNRKENLRRTIDEKNLKHRNGKNSNNKSGYRNVSWNSGRNKWTVQLSIEKKNTILDYFDDVHEAGRFAEEMRQKYYGEYAGAPD